MLGIRFALTLTCLLFFNFSFAQEKQGYLDSIYNISIDLSKPERIKKILETPYDKSVANIKALEQYSDSAIFWSKEIKDTILLADSYEKKALALHFTSRRDDAIDVTLNAIRLYESKEALAKAGAAYTNLGWKIKYLDLDKAFKYFQKGIKLLERDYDSVLINPAYDNYGVLHGFKEEWDSAFYYHDKALKIKKGIKDSVGIAYSYGHHAYAYLKNKEYSLAEEYLDSSMSLRKRLKDTYGIVDSYLYYGDLYFEQEKYRLSSESFEQALILAQENDYHPLARYASDFLYKSYKEMGDLTNALKYHELFISIKDSMLNAETSERINKLQIEYETEKKEKEILSQRADIAEQKLVLNRKNTTILSLAIFAIIIGLLGYMFFNQQKIKNRQLKKETELKDALFKIETQERMHDQRLRISRDLHDNIGSQLTFITSAIDNIKYGSKLTETTKNKLGDIRLFTAATINELRDTIWAMNKSSITLDELFSRLHDYLARAKMSTDKFQFKLNNDLPNSQNLVFSSIVGINAYRIIQESINNAIKYSKAELINLTIESIEDKLIFIVEDDGIGFDITKIDFGNGLMNMEQRAKEIDAELNIDSNLNQGTIITLKTSTSTKSEKIIS